MSFFKNIFGNSDASEQPKAEAKFYTLNDVKELETIDELSFKKPVVIFKHSTSCSISRFVLKQFDADFNFTDDKIDWYLLDLLSFRPISNAIAERYNIQHQSPQILVIKNGVCIYNASHESIDVNNLKEFIS